MDEKATLRCARTSGGISNFIPCSATEVAASSLLSPELPAHLFPRNGARRSKGSADTRGSAAVQVALPVGANASAPVRSSASSPCSPKRTPDRRREHRLGVVSRPGFSPDVRAAAGQPEAERPRPNSAAVVGSGSAEFDGDVGDLPVPLSNATTFDNAAKPSQVPPWSPGCRFHTCRRPAAAQRPKVVRVPSDSGDQIEQSQLGSVGDRRIDVSGVRIARRAGRGGGWPRRPGFRRRRCRNRSRRSVGGSGHMVSSDEIVSMTRSSVSAVSGPRIVLLQRQPQMGVAGRRGGAAEEEERREEEEGGGGGGRSGGGGDWAGEMSVISWLPLSNASACRRGMLPYQVPCWIAR